jgi:1-pyrroline-5-carboxylate dehydrogenase
VFTTEYFGPILALYVYDDADFGCVLDQMESVAAYGLTGAVIKENFAAPKDHRYPHMDAQGR